MNVARLNFSHGDNRTHGEIIDLLKEALRDRPNKSCALMLDTRGQEIRTGSLRDNKPLDLVAGQELQIVTDFTHEGDIKKVGCNYKDIMTTVRVGSTIYIADGNCACEVIEILDSGIKVLVKNDARLLDRKKMAFPGCELNLPVLTEVDIDDITDFGIKRNFDFIAASYIRSSDDIQTIRNELGPKGAYCKIFAKI
jgi:pyruvate kinase